MNILKYIIELLFSINDDDYIIYTDDYIEYD